MQVITTKHKTISIFSYAGSECPIIYLNTFSNEGQKVFEAAQAASCPPFTLVAISDLDWNHDMVPWDSPPAFKNADPCTGGADDYLPKPFEPKELVLRIKSILKRAPKAATQALEILNLGLCIYNLSTKELTSKQGQVIHITPVEQSLLSVLGQKYGQVFSREKLAEILGAGQSPRSIDVQITRLRKKIEKDSKNPRFLQTVRGKGYMLLPE